MDFWGLDDVARRVEGRVREGRMGSLAGSRGEEACGW